MSTDPEAKKKTQPLCGNVHPQADANDRQCMWILCWMVIIGTFVAAGLITLGGCQ